MSIEVPVYDTARKNIQKSNIMQKFSNFMREIYILLAETAIEFPRNFIQLL